VVRSLGATILGGLVGDVAIPKQTGGATAYWVAESGAPTESQQAVGQLGLTPKTVGAFTDISRKMLKQSSIDAEAFVRRDLASVIALATDSASINGSGASNQPTGIRNTTGIGAVVCGDPDGAAPVWADIVALESEVAADNADVGALAYLTNAKMRGKLKTTEKASNTAQFIWPDMPIAQQIVNGYTAAVSNQVPSDLTKGGGSALSAMLFGNWADLTIAMWGTLDLTVDPYTGSTSGTVRVVALQDIDIGVRHAESFAAIEDAVTT
jgi:HK97 family phage major capsid protein